MAAQPLPAQGQSLEKERTLSEKKMHARSEEPRGAESSQPRFEDALEKLQESVTRLEAGELDLSDALACYEQGIRQLKVCYDVLEQAERRIELLCRVDAEGNPTTRPYADEDMTLEQKRESRGDRRSHSLQIDDPPSSH
jgi:exodeoxyribonuclease VII small subunit